MTRKSGNPSLYMSIYNEIRDQILSGELKPENLLPSENELSVKYDVSRVTVRQSLKQLENEGLIYSRPKRGYFVGMPQMEVFTVPYYKNLDKCQTVLKDVTVVLANDEIQEALGVTADKKVIVLPRIRYDGDFPFSYEVTYMPYSKGYPTIETSIDFAAYPEFTAAKITPFSFYIEMEMQVAVASGEVAAELKCAADEPMMRIRRYFIKQDGSRLSYAQNYIRSPYDKLWGVSGYKQF